MKASLEWVLLHAGILGYAVALVFAFLYLRRGALAHSRWVRILALAGASCHTLLLVSLGQRSGAFPITNEFESLLFLTSAAMLLVLLLTQWMSLPILTALALPFVFTLTVVAVLFAPSVGGAKSENAALLNSFWAGVHISVTLFSYVAFALAFVTGLLYLFEQKQLKEKLARVRFEILPSLEGTYKMMSRAIAGGWILFTAGIIAGYLYARPSISGSKWRTDPTVWLATFTWLIYLVVLISNWTPRFRGRRVALASVLSFALLLFSFWARIFWRDFHHFNVP